MITRRTVNDHASCLRRLSIAFSVMIFLPTISTSAETQNPPDKVLAIVNRYKITQSDIDAAIRDEVPTIRAGLSGKARDDYVLDYLIDSALVLQQAREDLVDSRPGFMARLRRQQSRMLISEEMDKVAKSATSDRALRELYDQLVLKARGEHRYPPSFEEAKPKLLADATKKAQSDLLERLRRNAKIKRLSVR